MTITIDSDFKSLIPPLTVDEYALLEASIKAEGCRDALVVWGDILIDGHNRYEICQKHGVTFQTTAREFDSREDVIIWMVDNQFSRRNLNTMVKSELVLKKKAALEKIVKRNMSSAGKGVKILTPLERVNEALGDSIGVSHETIRKVEKVTNKAPASVQQSARKGDISVDRAYKITMALEKLPTDLHEAAIKLCGDNEEKVNILVRLHKSQGSPETNGTFDELMSTGGFHWGGELEKWCNYSAAGVEEIQRGLKSIADYHARLESDKRREERVSNIVKLSLDNQTYPLLYADPPWEYDHQSTPNRAIENHYDTQSLQWICAMEIDGRKVSEIVTTDAVLFMWATNPKLAEAFQVIAAWGFTYVTNMVWVKDKIGQGYYGRSQHELLLIAKRGNIPVALPSDRPSSVLYAPRTEHSAKPHEFYSIIESMYPEYAKLELFSRNVREGWKSWGNDLTEGETINAA